MELRTERLRIIPLSLEQFGMLLGDIRRLENSLGLRPFLKGLAGHTQEAMLWLYDEAMKHPEDLPWYTSWLIILAEENVAIGSGCFKGAPDGTGCVEAGYGIDPAYRNRGFMTEAAGELYAWALRQPGVRAVMAETDGDNMASQRVCVKCGMEKLEEKKNSVLWRIRAISAVEPDHIFICTSPGAPIADALVQFGLREGSPNTHPGQGTANRRFFFRNMTLELLWVDDAEQARGMPAGPLHLYERCREDGNASPFGLAFRPFMSGAAPENPGFPTWKYHPPYLPEPLRILIAADVDVAEPLYFYLPFAGRQDSPDKAGIEPLEHPCGFREVTLIDVRICTQGNLSPAARTIGSLPGISIEKGERHLLEITFDHGIQGRRKDFLPHLPLVFKW